MSWISFWIKPDAVPARVTLCVTSLLTLSTQHAQSQKSLPPVSYIKAIDIFMSSCTVFVFASLMEYALVNILMTSDEKRDFHQHHTVAGYTATGHTVFLTSSASASSSAHHHQLHQLSHHHHHQLTHQNTGLHSAANAIVANVNSINTSTPNTRFTGAATTVELSSSNAANTTTTTHLRVSFGCLLCPGQVYFRYFFLSLPFFSTLLSPSNFTLNFLRHFIRVEKPFQFTRAQSSYLTLMEASELFCSFLLLLLPLFLFSSLFFVIFTGKI